jgi:glucose/arabinose dehydrogenase
VKRIVLLVGAAAALVVALGLGSGAVLCRYKLDCRLHGSASESDERLLESRIREGREPSPAVLVPGLAEDVVGEGFRLPTDFAFLPDGRVLVAEKAGRVQLLGQRGAPRVVLDLRARVDQTLLRGLVAVAVDPDFERNRWIYVVYTPRPLSSEDEAPTVVRFSRFTLGADGRAGGERVLVGKVGRRSCTDLPSTADCLPSDLDHVGAQIAFAKDGTIYLSTGDGGGRDEEREETALRALDVDSLSGKVLHVTRDGLGLPSNPFWNGDPRANRSKVWALGLRNPFRLVLDPVDGLPVVGDVGRSAVEEIDIARRGANLGWPCYEGDRRVGLYADDERCQGLYAAPPGSVVAPVVAVRHPQGASITGGAFAPDSFPAGLGGAYLFADWGKGWLRAVHLADGRAEGASRQIGTDLPGPTAIHTGPGQAVYYAALNTGELRRIRRAG